MRMSKPDNSMEMNENIENLKQSELVPTIQEASLETKWLSSKFR
jgi:hypothetical protein